MSQSLEARFEAQLDELNERLRACLQPYASADQLAARGILQDLIAGYQRELSAVRAAEGPVEAMRPAAGRHLAL